MNLLEEYTEMLQIPLHIAVCYKFFSLFKVEKGELIWGPFSTPLKEDTYGAVKAFLKEQRSLLRDGTLTKRSCSLRTWFWLQKIIELGLFKEGGLPEILKWAELSDTITYECFTSKDEKQ